MEGTKTENERRRGGPQGSLSRRLTLSLRRQVDIVRSIPASYVGHTLEGKIGPAQYWGDTLGAGSNTVPILGLDLAVFKLYLDDILKLDYISKLDDISILDGYF